MPQFVVRRAKTTSKSLAADGQSFFLVFSTDNNVKRLQSQRNHLLFRLKCLSREAEKFRVRKLSLVEFGLKAKLIQ